MTKRWRLALSGLVAVIGGMVGANYALAPDPSAPSITTPGAIAIGPRRFRDDGRARFPPRPVTVVDTDTEFTWLITETQNGSTPCTGDDLVASFNGINIPVTVTRSTGAWCTKGNETRDIANGDMVLISANKPRWMPGGEGDAGLGVSVWASRTNYLLRSQAFDNAAWRKYGCVGGVSCADNANITVTANAGTAPDGTATAEFVECTGSCFLSQDVCPVDYAVRSVYVRLAPLDDGGVRINGLPDGGAEDGGLPEFYVGGNTVTRHGLTSASWTRMLHDDQADNAIYFAVAHWNGVGLGAASFYVWQADCQRNSAGGVRATHPRPPPIATTAATVTTADEVLEVVNSTPPWTDLTWNATFQPQNSPVTGVPFAMGNSINGVLVSTSSRLVCETINGGVHNTVTGTPALTVNQQVALVCTYNGMGRLESCTDGACLDAGSQAPNRHPTTTIGSEKDGTFLTFGSFANGVVKNVRITSSAKRDIYLVGDSIVEANSAGAGFQPQYIIHGQLGNRVSVVNNAVSGYTIEQCRTVWDETVAAIRTAGTASRSYMMVQCGTNSNGGPSPDDGGTAIANAVWHLETMLASGRDAGIHVLGSTITPTGLTCASFAAPVNAALASWSSTNGFAWVDTFTPLKDPALCALASAYDFGDALHLNDAGVNLETQLWITGGGW